MLQTHAQAHAEEYPKAAETVDNSMYVDDVLDSCETTQEAQVLHRELSDLLRKGGFSLRKWSSNEPLVLKDIRELLEKFDQDKIIDVTTR